MVNSFRNIEIGSVYLIFNISQFSYQVLKFDFVDLLTSFFRYFNFSNTFSLLEENIFVRVCPNQELNVKKRKSFVKSV